jgi:uncharacterized cupin superfamily protein
MTNLHEPEWQAERRGRRRAAVAAPAGAQRLGASVIELAPGALSSPYHFHHANEELLVVLTGTPELRTPGGLRELAPGDVVAFPRGSDGAHRLRNPSPEPCRVLIVSEMHYPDVVEYLDTGAVLTLSGPRGAQAFPGGSDRPLRDVVVAALDADPSRAVGPQDGPSAPGEP